jgi:hypothetical protein
MDAASRKVPDLAWVALLVGVIGLGLVFSGPPDPLTYVGIALIALAPLLAMRAFVRYGGVVTFVVIVLTLIPLVLISVLLYLIAIEPPS